MQILAKVKNLWMKLNLRGAILMSLSLQVFLIFFAPIRKRCSNRWIVVLTWSAYLVADLVADYALGLIAKAQFNVGTSQSKADAYGDLLAFWAPFLLLHLGGPDTITAFALEDNELWRRHLLNLLFQLGAAVYVFYQSLPSNKLIVPTILMFIGGTTKYIERTRALYIASFRIFRDSLLTSFEAGLQSPIEHPLFEEINAHMDDKEVIQFAFFSFLTFKRLLVDLPFRLPEFHTIRDIYRRITAKDAFRLIEAELNYFYDVLYTKAPVVRCPLGYLFRAISIGSVITAFAFFYVLNKHGIHEYDIQITYILLLGAVGLEFVAFIMLICSDWTIALSRRLKEHRIGSTFINFLLKFKSEGSSFALRRLHARWSTSIFQYNLIDSRLRMWPKWIDKFCFLGQIFIDLKSGGVEPYRRELGELIFKELNQKSLDIVSLGSIKELCASRGKWALEHSETNQHCEKLLPFVRDVDYDESLLLWHIATELCHNADNDESTNTDRVNSKVLSDYMLHLMIKQPDMMSTVAGFVEIRFRYTCDAMDEFISKNICKTNITKKESVCKSLLSIDPGMKPYLGEGDAIQPTLLNARFLAIELQSIEKKCKWKIISKVWVELLAYAAIHCRPHAHAQQLSQGGELITLVWLLMVHFGLSELFRPVRGPQTERVIA